MSEITNIYASSQSDNAILKTLSSYIKHHRLEQNKSQSQLALEAGINRSTLIEFEKGKHGNLLTFIQLLRALNLLSVLNAFQISQQISPLLLAEAEMAKRKRASKTKPTSKKPKSSW